MSEGLVDESAFEPLKGDDVLSFTYQGESLRSIQEIEVYQECKRFPMGDLPGICSLSYFDLAHRVQPPLPPRPEEEEDDKFYGDLHCCTDVPSPLQRETMADLATPLCDYKRCKRPRSRS